MISCLFVRQQDYVKSTELISIKLGGGGGARPKEEPIKVWICINRQIQDNLLKHGDITHLISEG